MVAIHPRLQTSERRFVLIGAHGEELKKPFETGWQETANYQYDDPKLLAHRGNYGVCGGYGDLHIVDCDDLKRWEELEILPLIPSTLTIESRPGHRQYYITCKEHFQSCGLFDPEKTEINEQGKSEYVHIGDIKASSKDGICGGQAVGPGCKHPSGSTYQVIEDLPIAEVSRKHLQSIISRFKTSKKVNTDNQRAEEQATNTKRTKYEAKDSLDSLQVVDIMPPKGETSQSGDELRGDHPVHGSKNGGNYVINTAKNVWHCKRCESGGGPALAIAVKEGIISCSEAGPGTLRGDLFKDVLKVAKEKGYIKTEGLTPEAILSRIKADQRALKDPAILKAMAMMKATDPIEYDLLITAIKKANKGLKADTIRQQVDKYALERESNDAEAEEIPEDLQRIAMRIAEHGKPLKYMLNTFNKTHKGDKLHAESQFIGFGLQSAYNTKGVFGTWDGPSGKGKSDGAKACIRQLPPKYAIISSVTAKSLYRRAKENGILPGSVLFLDDKNIEAGSDLEETLKRIQTFFQEGAEHETIDGKGGYLKTKLPPRLVVVRTYVNSSDSDEQLKNRSLDFGVDSSKETDKEVCDLVLKLGESGQTTDVVTRQTLICRALWRDIKENVYRVKTPASSQLIEFSDVHNRRNSSLFLDMVIGLACIHHRQRLSENGPNGEKILYANYEDYLEAARLFNSQGDYLGTRLDKSEYEAVQYIKDQGNEGASIGGIFSHLSSKFPNDGWNAQKVRRLMDGRPEREIKGLADKVPGIDPRWQLTDSGSKYKVYSISGDLALGVQVTVHDPRTKNISSEDLSRLSHRFPKMGKEVNDSNIPTIPTTYPKYPIKEKDGNDIDTPAPCGVEIHLEKNVLSSERSLESGKTGKTGQANAAVDSEKAPFPSWENPGNDGKTGIGPHPRKEEDPCFQKFKANKAKRQCCLCGRSFPYDLTPFYGNGVSGFICVTCHMSGPPSDPPKIDAQTQLN